MKRKLRFAIALTFIIMLLEAAGGIFTGSLALLADAGHVFMDVFALSLSLMALSLADIQPDKKKTYGWHRAEVFAAFINGCALVLISLTILREAYQRILEPSEVLPFQMLAVAAAGLIVNLVVARQLHSHDRHDLNVRSAYFHVISDILGSVVVIAGAVIIGLTGIYIIDPVLSAVISVLILAGSIRILRESLNILLEGVPFGIKLDELAGEMSRIDGVNNVHDLHIWSVCSHIVSLSCHVVIREEDAGRRDEIICSLRNMLWKKFHIRHSTIEVDGKACSLELISKDLAHDGHH